MQKEEYLKDNASLMLQIGNCCHNHLIINVFLRLGIKARIDSLPFAFFVTKNKRK